MLFERFLDENRKEAPDIDIDFCKERRALVMQYVKGETFVAWPAKIKTIDAVLPLPAGHPYASR